MSSEYGSVYSKSSYVPSMMCKHNWGYLYLCVLLYMSLRTKQCEATADKAWGHHILDDGSRYYPRHIITLWRHGSKIKDRISLSEVHGAPDLRPMGSSNHSLNLTRLPSIYRNHVLVNILPGPHLSSILTLVHSAEKASTPSLSSSCFFLIGRTYELATARHY